MRCKARGALLIFMLTVCGTIGLVYLHHLASDSYMIQQPFTRFTKRELILPIAVTATAKSNTVNHTSKSKVMYVKLKGVDSSEHDLFATYGASIDYLKQICSSLDDCKGFNSKGWVKSSVDSKHSASSIDLYIKHKIEVGQARIKADPDAGVFHNHLESYDMMCKNLKIYIYNIKIGQEMPSYMDYKYGVEYLFISLLAKSKFRTENPNEATFYFIPARCSAYRKSASSLADGIDKAANTMKSIMEYIKLKYSYWNKTLGTDHFYLCAHDMGTELVKYSDPNLWKNSIGLVNTADSSEPLFIPHKDISLPPHPGKGSINWVAIGQGGATFNPKLRTKLAFIAGHPRRGIRPELYQLFQNDSSFHIIQGYISDRDYMNALKSTKFCLCPRGNKVWSPRLMDAIWFGCVPVIIADYYILPLASIIDWKSVAVIIQESQISKLKEILMNIPEKQLSRMQTGVLAIQKHLTWNDPPQPYDAFYSILFELWHKQINVRRKPPSYLYNTFGY